MQDFPIWQRLLTFSALLVFQKHARQQHCCGQKFSVGEGDFLHQFKSSSGIVRRIENLTKLLKIPHSQKARGLSRAGMILMVGIGQYWLIYIETKFSEWLLVWQCVVDQRCFKSPSEQISSKFGGCEFRPDQQIWSSWSQWKNTSFLLLHLQSRVD